MTYTRTVASSRKFGSGLSPILFWGLGSEWEVLVSYVKLNFIQQYCICMIGSAKALNTAESVLERRKFNIELRTMPIPQCKCE